MSTPIGYIPTEWKAGDVVTAAKLNKLEEGVANAGGGAGSVLVVTVSGDPMTLDKTWQEIYDAAPLVMLHTMDVENNAEGYSTFEMVMEMDSMYAVLFCGGLGFIADSADGYPIFADTSSGGSNPSSMS